MTRAPPSTEPDLGALMRQEEERDAKVAHRRHLANITLLIPPVVGVVLLILAAVLKGGAFAGALIGQAILIFTVAGKFAILQGVLGGGGFTAVELATLVSYMDISIAVVLPSPNWRLRCGNIDVSPRYTFEWSFVLFSWIDSIRRAVASKPI